MVQMSAVRQGEVAQLQAVLQPHATHDGGTELDQPGASYFEVFNVIVLSFFCKSVSHLRIRYIPSLGYSHVDICLHLHNKG